MVKFLLFIVTNLLLIAFHFKIDASQITIERNGYSGIVVAVSPDIPNDNAAVIIQNIQVIMEI